MKVLQRPFGSAQYTSEQFRSLMEDSGVTCSMTKSGKFGTILQWKFYFPPSERTARKVYHSRNQARADVFDFIERFYNRKRRHSTTGYLNPIEFERRAEVTQATVNKTGGISERGKPITLPFVFRANPTYRPPPYFP